MTLEPGGVVGNTSLNLLHRLNPTTAYCYVIFKKKVVQTLLKIKPYIWHIRVGGNLNIAKYLMILLTLKNIELNSQAIPSTTFIWKLCFLTKRRPDFVFQYCSQTCTPMEKKPIWCLETFCSVALWVRQHIAQGHMYTDRSWGQISAPDKVSHPWAHRVVIYWMAPCGMVPEGIEYATVFIMSI